MTDVTDCIVKGAMGVTNRIVLDKLRHACERQLECVEDGIGTCVEYWKGGKMALYDLCVDLGCATEAHLIMKNVEETNKDDWCAWNVGRDF